MKFEYKKLLLVLILWECAIVLFFYLGLHFLPLQHDYLGGSVNFKSAPLLWSHANYDGEHYIEIAQFGYGPLRYFFFPLYPVLLRFVSHYLTFVHFPLVWAGVSISTISFFIGSVVFYKLLRLDYSEDVSFRAVLFLLIFPSSFYFTGVYTEALFFVLCVSAFYFARKGNWVAAGILGIFASMTRLIGIILLFSLLFEWGVSYLNKKQSLISIIPIVCIPLGLLFYMAYLRQFMGDPLAFFHNITTYGDQRSEHLVLLPQVFYRYVFKIIPYLQGYMPLIFTTYFELISAILFSLISVIAFFKVRTSYVFFLIIGFLVPTLSGSFSSLPRYVIVLFPAFIVLSLVTTSWARKYKISLYVLLTIFLAIFTGMFTVGFWVS